VRTKLDIYIFIITQASMKEMDCLIDLLAGCLTSNG